MRPRARSLRATVLPVWYRRVAVPEKHFEGAIEIVECDFLDEHSLKSIPKDIDIAYYLIHSMSSNQSDFQELEKTTARNFRDYLSQTEVKQVIYLSGIINDEKLSKHLASRKSVEQILSKGSYHLTTLRAGIIVGSGSASFEIIRDLVEKLPVMIAPKWLKTPSQPIAIRNVIEFLARVISREATYDQSFDIGGPDILNYKEMLLKFAHVRGLRRNIWIVPVMTPRLSSYWLYFVTSTSYKLAVNLVNSMKVKVVCRQNNLPEMMGVSLLKYEDAIREAFDKIEQQAVISSWTDALSSNTLKTGIGALIEVPSYGCFKNEQNRSIKNEQEVLDKIWQIGGRTGWYYASWIWKIRGFLDKLLGGVGLRRGRKDNNELSAGESLDFWRVIYASRQEKRLLLYAEMKLPGEAWLEFSIENNQVHQTATFRPLGLGGRLYWYALYPFHFMIFNGMINRIAKNN